MLLKAATIILCYCETIGREITAVNMRWTTTIKAFVDHWKALEECKKEDGVPDVPKITKHLAVTKWTEAFAYSLAHVMGRRNLTLYYVIRKDSVVPATSLPLAALIGGGLYLYSTEYGSIEGEPVA